MTPVQTAWIAATRREQVGFNYSVTYIKALYQTQPRKLFLVHHLHPASCFKKALPPLRSLCRVHELPQR